MRLSGSVLAIVLVLGLTSSFSHGKRSLPAPVHPDTLPTLIQKWSLPASLAPYVTNVHAPRMTRDGMLLYVYDHHGRRLVAVKANSGKVVWHKPVPSRSNVAFALTPLVARKRVFVAGDGYLYSFNSLDGQPRWKLGIKGVPINGLARSKHHIYLPWIRTAGRQALPGVHLWAIDSRRGRIEWSKKFPGRLAFVRGDADGVYYVGDTGVILGLTPDRGDFKWQLRVKGRVTRAPILKSGKLYISSLRKKAGWSGTGITVVDVAKGKVLWKTKLSSPKVTTFLHNKMLVAVEGDGRLTEFDNKGKKSFSIDLNFFDVPRSLHGVSVDDRAYVFSSHNDGNGYIRLIDLANKRMLAAANALDMKVNALIPAAKMVFLDGADGNVYAYRLDRSQRPKRASVPAGEFAQQLIDRAMGAKKPIKTLAETLAGLGPKALSAIHPALTASNPFVAEVAARAVGLIGNRRSVQDLIQGVKHHMGTQLPPGSRADPLLAIIDGLAELKDGRAVSVLQQVLKNESLGHQHRRAAYVALGAIGTPRAMNPIWSFKATRRVTTTKWEPQTFTPSYSYRVEQDVDATADSWPEKIRKQTAITAQGKNGQVYTAALSPYLGGYNDIWIGKSDLSGVISEPLFTGLTKPEVLPNRRIRFKKLKVSPKGKINLVIQMKQGKKWITAKPVELSISGLAADRDGDKLPDNIEQRLHLCVTHADCDGDGLKDAEDLNPLASSKSKLSLEQRLFQEAFFTYFAFLKRRGIVVVDPGDGPSFELYGRMDPILSLRRPTIERFRKEVGLHAVDFVSFGGPYPEGGGSGDAMTEVVFNKRKNVATLGMDIFRSGENAVAYNVTLKKVGKNWAVSRFHQVWTTN